MTKISPAAQKISNILGSFGYLSVLIEYLLYLAIVIMPLIGDSDAKSIFTPSTTTKTEPGSIAITLPPQIQLIIAVIAVIFCLAVFVYAIYALPRGIGRVGRAVVAKSTRSTIAQIEKKQPISLDKKKRLSIRVSWSIKIALAILPALLIILPIKATEALPREVAIILVVFCLFCSLFWFGCQFVIAKVDKLDPKNIW